jgi:hypothetical protein
LKTVSTNPVCIVDFLADAETMRSRDAFDDWWGFEWGLES